MKRKELLELYKKIQETEHTSRSPDENTTHNDIQEILEKLDDEQHDYLENKTLKSISQDIYDILKINGYSDDKIETLYNKLNGYRYVENINELHVGKEIKVLRIANPYDATFDKMDSTLKYYGKVTNIIFEDNGILVRSITFINKIKYCNYKYDNFLTFQKLTPDEKIMIALLENDRE
jgi:hypothetical protein